MNEKLRYPMSGTQVPGVYRRKLGAYEITTLSDGFIDFDDFVWNANDPATLDAARKAAFLPDAPKVRNGVNAFLVNTGNRLVLIDSGSGDLFGDTAGKLPGSLAAAGVRSEDIDTLLLTHIHPDHFGGALREGVATFPNATVRINDKDLEYWTSSTHRAAAPTFQHKWFDSATAFVKACDERIEPFSGEADLGEGLSALPLPGHTPGHTGVVVESAGENVLFWSDTCISAALQFAHPEVEFRLDVDVDLGKRTRLASLQRAADEGLLIAATHLPFPSFGYVDRRGSAFAWVPEEWRYET